MPEPASFDYATIRVVPRVEREEFLNAGVILFCRTLRFLGCLTALDRERLTAFAPWLDTAEVERHLAYFPLVSTGAPEAGPPGAWSLPQRFHWLTAPRSTIVQPSPVHTGLCIDPEWELEHLLRVMVLPPEESYPSAYGNTSASGQTEPGSSSG